MVKISVVVPVYRVEQYLNDCVDSILNQTFEDFELILVDDGSPDNCGKICDEYSIKDNRIKVIHKQNGGLASARNAGIDIAEGEYIAFIDSDDVIHTQYLEFLYFIAQKENADIAMAYYDFFRENKKWFSDKIDINSESEKLSILNGKEILNNFTEYCGRVSLISMCMKLYKKKIFDDVRIPEGHIEEDSLTLPFILVKTAKIVRSELKLYHWRITPGSISRSGFTKTVYDYINVSLSNIKFFTEFGRKDISDFFKKQFMERVLKYYYKTIDEKPELMIYLKPYIKIYKKHFLNYFFAKGMCITERIAYVLFLISPKFARKFYMRVYG